MKAFQLFAAAVLAAAVVACNAAEMKAGVDAGKLLRDFIEKEHVAGIAAGTIDSSGTRVLAKGTLRKDGDKKVDGDTLFEIGSITKVFTSLLLADMTLRGEVKLEDPVSKYLPHSVKVPSRNGREIRLVDLATHTSGLPRLPGNLSLWNLTWHADNPYAAYTVSQMYEFLSGYSLPRDIGSKYAYSNFGAGLLGHALALKSGTNYETLVRERICKPLGMTNTFVTLPAAAKKFLAIGHNQAGKPVSNWDNPTLAGAGALISSVDDLLKFLAANMGKSKTALYPAMQLQFEPRHEAGSTNMQIGLAWHIAKKPYGQVIWHNGGTGGYHSFIGFCPQTGKGVVVLCNSEKDIDPIGGKLLEEP